MSQALPVPGFSPLPDADARAPGSPGMHPVWPLLLASLWMASVANLPLWRLLLRLPELAGWRGLGFSLGLGVIVGAALCGLLSLLSWRWTLKPMLTLSLLAAAAGAYFMLTYGVVIDPTMMANVLQTDPHETRDLLNWRLFGTVAGLGLLPAGWLWRMPVRRIGPRRQALSNATTLLLSLALVAGTLLLFFQDLSSLMRNHTQLRYLIYVSDHGESLGENQLYLHGLPYQVAPDAQKRVPWITWLSPSFERLRGLPTDCLKQGVDAPVSHDHYFHSVLGALGVRTEVYRPEQDIYARCRRT